MTAIVNIGCAALGAIQMAGLRQLDIKNPVQYGISSGAFVSAMSAQVGAEEAWNLWHQIKGRTDVFRLHLKPWKGVFNFDPLRELMAPHFKNLPQMQAHVCCLHQRTGKLTWFSNQKLKPEDFLERTLDAGRMAGFVRPAMFMDAGPAKLAPIGKAIRDGHEDIVVICGYPPEPETFDQTETGWKLAAQSFNRLLHNQTYDDIRLAYARNENPKYKKVKIRVFGPDQHMYDSFDFSKTTEGLKAKVVEFSLKRILRAE